MLLERSSRPLCKSCRRSLYNFFSTGFAVPSRIYLSSHPKRNGPLSPRDRSFQTLRPLKSTNFAGSESTENDASKSQPPYEQLEAAARNARITFGAALPTGHLSPGEYKVYERLYGPPLRTVEEDGLEDLEAIDREGVIEDQNPPTLYRELENGELEEIENDLEVDRDETLAEDLGSSERFSMESDEEYSARIALTKEGNAAAEVDGEEGRLGEEVSDEELVPEDEQPYLSDEERAHDESTARTHPYSEAGRFATFPFSIQLPKNTFMEPVAGILSLASKKQLAELSKKTFGGEGLPDSVATPSSKGRHLQQKPIALEAAQPRMGTMEANSFVAANMPGMYASVMSALVETRRRLGSSWVEGLLKKKDGPRVLDAGGAGAGVLAWHEILRAEWERMHAEDSTPLQVPLGKATVVTGSAELRQRVKLLLENTTFLPRMQDFVSTRDLPGSELHNPALRKQYDLIIAPHTLWPLKEDYMRKAQVQNYFTLLNPNGGVLIILEKGVPRGFELVAGAREVLLKHHIASPGAADVENEIQSTKPGRFTLKEPGMIIAPCTNHSTCPMYRTPGQMSGRKDHCHFSQRFVRPPFLQRILGATHHNYEDIKFSYLSVRRGVDEREARPTPQNEQSTLAALEGYGESEAEPNMLTLPRLVAPPIKRHRHVTFDLCTPAGNLERWTVPKSLGRQAYRDARKAKWGDLWALGAKTRVVRTSRSGSEKPRPKTRQIEIDLGETEEEDIIRDVTEGVRGRKDRQGRKRTKPPRKLREKDLV